MEATRMWINRLAYFRSSNRSDKAVALENLKQQIEEWRDSVADKLGMAPAGIDIAMHLTVPTVLCI